MNIILTESQYRILIENQDKIEGIEPEVKMFFEDDVIPSLKN
jgi:hypothetical protein